MRINLTAVLIVVCATVGGVRAELSRNGADLYIEAHDLLPDLTSGPDMEVMDVALRDWEAAPSSAKVRDLVKRCEPAVAKVREADRATDSDWHRDPRNDTASGQFNRMASLSAVLLLRARVRIADKDQAEALKDLRSAIQLGERFCDERSLNGTLQGTGMILTACDTVRRELHRLSPESLREIDGTLVRVDVAALMERAKDDHPPDNFPAALLSVRTQQALLRTAIAIRLDGKEAVSKSRDPGGEGPFEYEPMGDGFVLRSRLKLRGKPVECKVAALSQ